MANAALAKSPFSFLVADGAFVPQAITSATQSASIDLAATAFQGQRRMSHAAIWLQTDATLDATATLTLVHSTETGSGFVTLADIEGSTSGVTVASGGGTSAVAVFDLNGANQFLRANVAYSGTSSVVSVGIALYNGELR